MIRTTLMTLGVFLAWVTMAVAAEVPLRVPRTAMEQLLGDKP